MESANGYALEVQGHTLVASWPAPYFVLVCDYADDPSDPMLIHCDDLEHAQMHARLGGTLLDAKFGRGIA